MTVHPCTHGYPSPSSCITCMDEGNLPPAPVERESVEYTFDALYSGECPGCSLPIVPGQIIAKTSVGRYLHVGCAP